MTVAELVTRAWERAGDLPDPTPEPDQLVIRVAACGVYGFDIKAQPFAPAGIEPIIALVKELTIRYSVAYSPGEFQEVIAAFDSGGIDPTAAIGPTFGLDHVTEAFAAVREAQVHGRVSVTP
ncbi:MAG TPA: hypothetical protein VFR27_19805 [Mycobacterium sp.]|nr:hypothetical protein [Mycobacterium sp.]